MAFCEEFKTAGRATWAVSDDGISLRNKLYVWAEIEKIKPYEAPRGPFSPGSFVARINGDLQILCFSAKDADRADNAFRFIRSKLAGATEFSRKSIDSELVVFQESTKGDALQFALKEIPRDETLFVALKGAFKEYLFCTEKMVYIVKTGYMTGHLAGSSSFKLAYPNIANAHVEYHLVSGYFELSSGGVQNQKLDYWSNEKDSAQKAPNAISITGDEARDAFEQAAQFIMAKVMDSQKTIAVIKESGSGADEIRKLKELFDEGILTEQEFDLKKKQILGL